MQTRTRRTLLALATAALSALATLVAAGPAAAVPVPPPPCTTQAWNSHYVWTTETWPGGANWSVAGWGPGTLSMNRSETVSNTFSATASIKADDVTVGVGFSVTWSGTVGTSYATTVPAGQEWVIRAGYASLVYQFDVVQVCPGGRHSTVGHGWAEQYNHLIYMPSRIS